MLCTDINACMWMLLQCEPDYFSSLLRGQVIDCDVIDLHELVAGDEPTICRTTCTHKTSLCCHISGRPMGLHSHGHRGWWQTVARILLIYFHLTMMQNFHPFNPSETRIQSPSIHTPPCLYSHLCNLRRHQCLAAVIPFFFFFCLLFSVFCHFTASNKTSSYCC